MKRVDGPLSGLTSLSMTQGSGTVRGSVSGRALLSPEQFGTGTSHPLGPQIGSGREKAPLTRRVDVSSAEGQSLVQQARVVAEANGVDAAQLAPTQISADELGMTHVRFNRQLDGTPVYAEQLIVHTDPSGKSDVTNRLVPIDTSKLNEAKVPKSQAVEKTRALLSKYGTVKSCDASAVLYFSPELGHHVRAYEVCAQLESPSQHPHADVTVMIHGETGEPIGGTAHLFGVWRPRPFEIDRCAGAAGDDSPQNEPVGAADDKTKYSGYIEIKAEEQDGRYRLFDGSRGKGILTKDARGGRSSRRARALFDDNNKWGEPTDPENAIPAVDAHFAAQMAYDTIKRFAKMNSIDGRGYQLRSNVNVGRNFVNAYWDGQEMFYGNGDGRRAGPLVTLDIGGHEIYHGLTTNTWDGIYRGESGGLNESFSDIGGFLTEYHAAQQHSHLGWDWRMGEDAWTPGNGTQDALRYMNNPTQDDYSIDHYSNFPRQREVHGSSGISNHAFYQLADRSGSDKVKNSVSGVAIEGIGIDKAADIFHRGFINYLTRRATFSDARRATIRAAKELYGEDSVEAKQTAAAWSAVGVEGNNTSRSNRDPLEFLEVLETDHPLERSPKV